MEEEIKTLEAQIQSFYDTVRDAGSTFDPELAKEFLETFEEFELSIDSFLSLEQYIDLMVLYFVTDNWRNPAKFLWKRIPKAMKKDKALVQVWEIGKCLFQYKYPEAAQAIRDFKGGNLSDYLRSGYYHIMNGFINQAYQNIDDDTYRLLMGFSSAKEQKAYLSYYNKEVQPKIDAAKNEKIEINASHLDTLKKLAEFIEKEGATQIERE
ncbi:unnamed protein product [Moneuplotes crassus]|uniref:CSN8/PSMD8/EIF3K domain-containing protein n=2 Tax=Euplotes crassus TaxID=5936 RepID=A0AAD2D4J0_EUPCR|nr:unnamed protein product [Moneuplotes crassus]